MTDGALVLLRGGGDLGTGVAHRLVKAGYRVVILEANAPCAVRRTVSFAEAVRAGEITVEGVLARRTDLRADGAPDEQLSKWLSGLGSRNGEMWVPVLVDPDGVSIAHILPDVIVDARMAKRNLGTRKGQAKLTVALGPGFEAGKDVDLVIETKRGHDLGRVISNGPADADTGVPGDVAGVGAKRLLRSPGAGVFRPEKQIGDIVSEGDTVGLVGTVPVRAATSGLLRGLVADGLEVTEGEKLGDVDPRGRDVDPHTISDKARAVGGAVLEALLSRGMLPARRPD